MPRKGVASSKQQTAVSDQSQASIGKKLVIVESPSKAKTLGGFLGSDYKVLASYGHVMDLPKPSKEFKTGVDTEHDFKVKYVVVEKAAGHLADIKEAAAKASEVYLATDPDREGEAIAWHVQSQIENIKPQILKRVAFHEITKAAVAESFASPRELDMNLVNAQQGRRVLDRLVGYELSPLLWKKVIFGLSAGRVQSVAVRLIVEREKERQAFKPEEYWTVEATFSPASQKPDETFVAQLVEKNDKKVEIKNAREAESIVVDLEASNYTIRDVARTERKRSPYAPFTTSSMQQAAGNVLGLTAKKTMDMAQKLFEAGHITYHRTDSTNLSPQFLEAVRGYIAKEYGPSYVPEKVNDYPTKSKNAQEAHEAIRPTELGLESVPGDLGRLYRLIWQRAVASQMVPAVYDVVTVNVAATENNKKQITSNNNYLLRSTGSTLKFDGCLKVLGSNGDDAVINVQILGQLAKDQVVTLIPPIKSAQHFTEPPARYTEASLVKALEEYGIGRPSTYAPTISTIQARGYVGRDGRALFPKDVAFVVNDLLVKHFPEVVDYQFTAKMEEELDEVAEGTREWVPVVREFYTPFHKDILQKDKELKKSDFVNLGPSEKICPECGKPLVYKLGRYGKFLSCSGWPKCKYAEFINVPVAEGGVNQPTDEEIAEQMEGGCPQCGSKLVLKTGPFGKFIACETYPKCKFTKPILHKIGLKCPKCEVGEVVKKYTKRRRLFFGCSRYPECDFASWNDPRLPEPEKKTKKPRKSKAS